MADRFDVEAGVKEINEFLMSRGFEPRDTDGADFQRGDDRSLRFKTGTVYGEVTITVWRNNKQRKEPIRILSDKHLERAKESLDSLMFSHAQRQEGNK